MRGMVKTMTGKAERGDRLLGFNRRTSDPLTPEEAARISRQAQAGAINVDAPDVRAIVHEAHRVRVTSRLWGAKGSPQRRIIWWLVAIFAGYILFAAAWLILPTVLAV